MFSKKTRLSRSSLIVIVMCILVLFTIFILSFFNIKHSATLQSTVDELSKEDSSIVLLQKCDKELEMAENHYRIYINSGDSIEKQSFLNDIGTAVDDCNKINFDDGLSTKLKQDVAYKMIIYSAIKKLKLIADTVSGNNDFTSTTITFNSPVQLSQVDKSFFERLFSNSTDTLRLYERRKKMNFFQKVGYLFSNKDNAKVNTEFVKGSPAEKKSLDSLKHKKDSTFNFTSKEIKNYYSKSANNQWTVRQQLSEEEMKLAKTNLTTISDIGSSINNLLTKKEASTQERKLSALSKAVSAKSSIKKITFFSLLGILILITLLIYNIYRTNKYEEAIINAKASAEKLAVMKGRFLSNMSHEIRSPLTAIMGFTEQVANGEHNPDNIKYLDAIKVSSNHLLNTVNDILDFSKLEAGKLTLNKQPFSLKNAIEEVAFAFEFQAEKKGVALKSQIVFDDSLTVNGDAYRFKQILYNLISNAVKFTDKGSIEINAASKKVNEKNIIAVVAVKDSGIGILPSQFNMIFQEFAQVHSGKNNQARAIKGTGLGLPISKMLTELQNGSVVVESEPGKGSVFTVKIPYELSTPLNVKTIETKSFSSAITVTNQSEKNILLVEDNELNIMLISLLLERMGHHFDIAEDGEMALQLFKNNDYKLVLTDINIPKLTGVQLAELIRKDADSYKSKIKIVALTATILNDDFDSYYKAGIDKILVKPFTEEEFREVVDSMINVEQFA